MRPASRLPPGATPHDGDGPPGDDLAARLGVARAEAVRGVLRGRALSWAQEVAADRVMTADPGEALTAAAQRAFVALGGPLLIAWPELAVWRPIHGEGALTDLADGCGVAVGPIFDGGFYLIAMAEPLETLLAVPRALDAMNRAFVTAHEAEVGIGLLRPERGLRGASDVAAALADPLLDEELRRPAQLASPHARSAQCTGEWCNGSPPPFGGVRSRFKSGLPNSSKGL